MLDSVYNFSGGFSEIIEIIGMELAREVAKELSGISFYIPMAESLERYKRNQQILADFNGSNLRELAFQYRITPRRVRDIVKEANNKTVPQSFTELEAIIGTEKAELLCKELGGGALFIPKYETFERLERNENIRREIKEGIPIEEIALLYCLTEREIKKIVQMGKEKNNEQLV